METPENKFQSSEKLCSHSYSCNTLSSVLYHQCFQSVLYDLVKFRHLVLLQMISFRKEVFNTMEIILIGTKFLSTQTSGGSLLNTHQWRR